MQKTKFLRELKNYIVEGHTVFMIWNTHAVSPQFNRFGVISAKFKQIFFHRTWQVDSKIYIKIQRPKNS